MNNLLPNYHKEKLEVTSEMTKAIKMLENVNNMFVFFLKKHQGYTMR